MKYKLPKVMASKTRSDALKMPVCWRLWLHYLAAFVVSSTLAFSQEPAAPIPVSGQDVVAQAAAQMTLHPSLEAKMRQRVGIGEQYMVGSGAYLQLRHGEDVRFRWELRLQVGERLTSLQHITDNRYLYIRRDIGETKGVGGLSQLLHGLADNFAFGNPESATISGVNVWRMNGRWKPEVLAKLLPAQSEAILAGQSPAADSLPLQLPDRVSLVVGRDAPLALFPYRVEFTRLDSESNQPRSMLIMELFEVRLRPDLDPRLFEVPDSEQDLVDETDWWRRNSGEGAASLPPALHRERDSITMATHV
ncbi:MAG: hypothetical protein HYV60_20075 [Planctomycetia bacterium]|nr:hypothetical protein [Planctomycetia bacterium]